MLRFQKDTRRAPECEPGEAWLVFVQEVELPQHAAPAAVRLLMPGVCARVCVWRGGAENTCKQTPELMNV